MPPCGSAPEPFGRHIVGGIIPFHRSFHFTVALFFIRTDTIPSLCRLLSIRVIAAILAGLDGGVCFFLYMPYVATFFISVLIGSFTDLDTPEIIVKHILPVTPWNGHNGRL